MLNVVLPERRKRGRPQRRCIKGVFGKGMAQNRQRRMLAYGEMEADDLLWQCVNGQQKEEKEVFYCPC